MHVLSINNFKVWCQTWVGFYHPREGWHVSELKFNEQVRCVENIIQVQECTNNKIQYIWCDSGTLSCYSNINKCA